MEGVEFLGAVQVCRAVVNSRPDLQRRGRAEGVCVSAQRELTSVCLCVCMQTFREGCVCTAT
eukprot:3940723-Rhodomonas_salina.2